MTKCLTRFRMEIGVISLVVDLFPKIKVEEGLISTVEPIACCKGTQLMEAQQ